MQMRSSPSLPQNSLADQIKKEIRFAIEVGPVMFFEVECSRVGSEGGFSKAREEALLNAFGPDTQADMALFIDPERSAANIEHLTVDWNEVPDLLLIDGVAIPIGELSGKVLTVTDDATSSLACDQTQLHG
jgi:hypothetical protein